MALSLVLRTAGQIRGASCLLRYTPVAFNGTSNFSNLMNKCSSNDDGKLMLTKLTPVLTPSVRCSSSDYRFLWSVERIFAVGLAVILPVSIAMPNPVFDNIAGILMVFHLHWGIEAVCTDYARPIVVGNALAKLALITVYLISATTLGGIMYFNYTDIGFGCAVRKLWAIKN